MPSLNGAAVDGLRQACSGLGIVVGWDGTVSEADAATLLNRSSLTLRNWRLGARPLEYVRSGNRARYSLAVLANFIEEGKEIFD